MDSRDFTVSEAIRWLLENNPEISSLDFKMGQPIRLVSSKPVKDLKLPFGWYYTEKNGITNKHNSTTGLYCCIEIMQKIQTV